MKLKAYLLSYLIIAITSCNSQTGKRTVKSMTRSMEKNASVSIPANVDDNFKTFLSYFNNDSIFQVSRINFPLTVKETDADFELKEHIIEKATFRKMDFTYNEQKVNKEYEQTVKIEKDKATIEIRGIENGILADYNFEKRKGKWVLVTWTDSST